MDATANPFRYLNIEIPVEIPSIQNIVYVSFANLSIK